MKIKMSKCQTNRLRVPFLASKYELEHRTGILRRFAKYTLTPLFHLPYPIERYTPIHPSFGRHIHPITFQNNTFRITIF